jgi:hypothetical protein
VPQIGLKFEPAGGVEGQAPDARCRDGYAILTNLRVVWVDVAAKPGLSCQLPLASVQSCHKAMRLGMGIKTALELKVGEDAHQRPASGVPCQRCLRLQRSRAVRRCSWAWARILRWSRKDG